MEKQIIIIGAGAAGIAAATKLILNGFRNILILEGQDRIGGRIHTIPCGASVLDMGAQWCHGEKGNVVYDLAKDKNLLSTSCYDYTSFNFIRSNGEQIPNNIGDKFTELYYRFMCTDEYDDEKRQYKGSLGNFFTEKFNLALQHNDFTDQIDSDVQHEVLDWCHRMQNLYDASHSWYDTSCHSITEYWECEGNHLWSWDNCGFITVLDLLQNKIPGTNSSSIDIMPYIQFKKDVLKITYNPNSTDSLIKIDCTDNSSYVASHLICTISLGVLKQRHFHLFEPILPTWKIVAIDGLMFGTVDKIYVEFEHAFWPDAWNGFSMLWKPEQLKEIQNDSINGDWLGGVVGFYPFNCQRNMHMLCCWITGKMAQQMEIKSDADIRLGIEKIFHMFLRHQSISKITNIIRSKWHSNPFFRGSYTNYSLKSDAVGATTLKLAEPIRNTSRHPLIMFAGEATDEHYYSTVHGAIQTGWREAQRLIDLYRPKAQL